VMMVDEPARDSAWPAVRRLNRFSARISVSTYR
jgi:hypothetical protein